MFKLHWATDIHLDFLEEVDVDAFWHSMKGAPALLTGDISNSVRIASDLDNAARTLGPIHYVLGNHDYYWSWVEKVRQRVPPLGYLTTDAAPSQISDDVQLIGHDGWGDATIGPFNPLNPELNDDLLIYDQLPYRGRAELRERLRVRGEEAARHIRTMLDKVTAPKVIVAIHVPPFRQCSTFQGAPSANYWAARFVCGQVGAILLDWAFDHPDTRLLTLCGHSHGGSDVVVRENLRVVTGEAVYGRPRFHVVDDGWFEWPPPGHKEAA